MSKIPHVFCGVFHNYIFCGVVGICVIVCLGVLIFVYALKWCHQIKTGNYKQGWVYLSPKYPQPKDTDIIMSVFCVN